MLSGRILEASDVFSKVLLCVRIRNGKKYAVADVGAKRVEVTVQEPAFALVEHIERFGLVGFDSGDRLLQHRLRFAAVPY
jgi:hypothetical protein